MTIESKIGEMAQGAGQSMMRPGDSVFIPKNTKNFSELKDFYKQEDKECYGPRKIMYFRSGEGSGIFDIPPTKDIKFFDNLTLEEIFKKGLDDDDEISVCPKDYFQNNYDQNKFVTNTLTIGDNKYIEFGLYRN
jgi:hypothetical protein